ncbi:MAG: hypothetical protein ACPL25_04175 [Ignavibacteria bacterium]
MAASEISSFSWFIYFAITETTVAEKTQRWIGFRFDGTYISY